jgi:hypothetical protein
MLESQGTPSEAVVSNQAAAPSDARSSSPRPRPSPRRRPPADRPGPASERGPAGRRAGEQPALVIDARAGRTIRLPAGTPSRISGTGEDIVLPQPGGRPIVIKNGVEAFPSMFVGDIEIPRDTLAAAFDRAGVIPGAGPRGSARPELGRQLRRHPRRHRRRLRPHGPPAAHRADLPHPRDLGARPPDEPERPSHRADVAAGQTSALLSDSDLPGGIGGDGPPSTSGLLPFSSVRTGGAASPSRPRAPRGLRLPARIRRRVLTVLQGGVAVVRLTIDEASTGATRPSSSPR